MAKKILCIDDSPTIRNLVSKALSPEGYAVSEAENGQEGLNKAKAERYDLFIVDVNMPVLDGFGFARGVKALPGQDKTPMVFLTTESSAEKKQMGKEIGINGWVVKPFDPPSLVKIVGMLVD